MTTELPKPPYTGAFKIVGFDPNEEMNYMQEMIFCYAPYSESWETSTRRLLAAIRADGECEISPTTIWLAYRRHKELQQPLNKLSTERKSA